MEDIAKYYSLYTGEEITREQAGDMAWQCLADERAFKEGAGFTAADDRLADCLVEEGVGPNQVMKFDVPAEIITAAKQRFAPREELYELKATG
jgi:aldehyde:ferredoxin oxidoreductase